jgi:hypothetical protein
MSMVSLASVPARADIAKAWSAAKAGLPADTKAVLGLDLAALQKSDLVKALLGKVMSADARQAIEIMKTTCKVDAMTVVQGAVIAVGDATSDGAAFFALAGVDRAKFSTCLQAVIANGDKAAKVTIKQDGPLTQIVNGTTTKYFGWIGKDVVVVPFKSDDKTAFAKWSGGKGALTKTAAQKFVAKANTSAPIWFAGEKPKSVDLGMPVLGGYGGVSVGGGKVGVDAHAKMSTADDATTLSKGIKAQLDQGKKAAEGTMPAAANVFGAVNVASAGDEVGIKANVTEADLAQVVSMAMTMTGGGGGGAP